MDSCFRSFVDIFFPRLCVVCRRVLTSGESHICSFCLADFPFSDQVFSTIILENHSMPVESVYSLFYYNKESPYSNLIKYLKYKSRKRLGVYLGRMFANYIEMECLPDAVLPVPLHPRKEKRRGYNQSVCIAKGIAEEWHIPMLEGALIRSKDNASQTGKNREERRENVDGVFALTATEDLKNKHVLLIDDVITTGATICSCAKILEEVEGLSVSLGSLARTSDLG